MAENTQHFLPTDNIEQRLKKSGLLNKNRGREKERWTSENPLEEFADKMLKQPKIVNCNNK